MRQIEHFHLNIVGEIGSKCEMFKKKLSGTAYRRKRNIKLKEAEKQSNRLKKYFEQNNESFEAGCGQDFGDSLPLESYCDQDLGDQLPLEDDCGKDLDDPGRGAFLWF